MKKVIAILVFLVLVSGILFSLELKNSTFIGGFSYDYIIADGHSFGRPGDPTIPGNVPFTSKISGFSVYGGYDVQVGNRWFSRLEYEVLVSATSFNYRDHEVPRDATGIKRKGSKKRFGGYLVFDLKNNIKLNVGGVITNITMGMTTNATGLDSEFVQDLFGLGLILEGQYDLGRHFTLRFGIVPDFTFVTIDRYEINYKDAEGLTVRKTTDSRATIFDLGFSISARTGVSYKF